MKRTMKMNSLTKSLVVTVAMLAMFGCTGTPHTQGSGGSGTNSSSTTYTIGGTVSGLTGTGLVLQDNGGDNLTITASGSFTFATAVASGKPYAVTILTQPTTPSQTCTVANGSGSATANVTTVQVSCAVPSLSIGGSVSGLQGAGLVLQDNGGDNLTINASGTFTFPTLLIPGATYKVTVLTQPNTPAQACTVTSGSGTASASVTNVQVVCPAAFFSIGGQVVGLIGSTGNMVLQDNGGDNLKVSGNGAFTFPTPVAYNSAFDVTIFIGPGTQPQGCITWGFEGTATANVTSVVIDCGHNDWTWMDGANTGNAIGQYTPPPGTPPTSPVQDTDSPGGRRLPATWTDQNGNLWLFGGYGYNWDSANFPLQPGYFRDLWVYNGTQYYFAGFLNGWTQVSEGIGTPGPEARWGAATWTDTSNNLWLFGGQDAGLNFLNDLWKYDVGTATWTQVGGTGPNSGGTYGAKGTTSGTNYPGSRWGATARFDATTGTVWMFGGEGDDSTGANGLLNDLWTFNTTSAEWTWVGGDEVVNQAGVYGSLGTASASNLPGGRQTAVSWLDSSGNFWLFGGYAGASGGQPDALNDLWEYSAGQWTWAAGSSTVNQVGVYTPMAPVPGARWSSAAWTDTSGNLWLFGGQGYDSTGNGSLSDLWEFTGGSWVWAKGPSSVDQAGIYGIGANPVVWPHVTSNPGGRWGSGYWTDPSGQLWMFGGNGFDSTGSNGNNLLNDLWRYLPYP
jgi:Galactose oxidase, central domain